MQARHAERGHKVEGAVSQLLFKWREGFEEGIVSKVDRAIFQAESPLGERCVRHGGRIIAGFVLDKAWLGSAVVFLELGSCGFAFVDILGQLLQLFKIGEGIATQMLQDHLVAAVLLTNVVVLRTEFHSKSFRLGRRGGKQLLLDLVP